MNSTMSLYDFFRRAFLPPNNDVNFNSPGQSGFRNPIWEEESDDYEDDLDELFGYAPNSPFDFRLTIKDFADMDKYFEQQMDEMLRNFQSSFFGSDLLQLPDGHFLETSKEDPKIESAPNKYLKPWFDNEIQEEDVRKDTDIDGRISAGDIKKFFPNEDEEVNTSTAHQVPRKVFGHSVITRIVRTSDGKVEEEKRVCGSDGREEVSLTRQIGEQKYKVITKKDSQSGLTDTTEELINLDEDKLKEFNRQWEQGKPTKPSSRLDKPNGNLTYYQQPTDRASSITRLFEKWFK